MDSDFFCFQSLLTRRIFNEKYFEFNDDAREKVLQKILSDFFYGMLRASLPGWLNSTEDIFLYQF